MVILDLDLRNTRLYVPLNTPFPQHTFAETVIVALTDLCAATQHLSGGAQARAPVQSRRRPCFAPKMRKWCRGNIVKTWRW